MKLLVTFFLCWFSTSFCTPRYVTSELMGELGNQMFQIAAATSLAYDIGAIPVFPDLNTKKNYNIPLNHKVIFSKLNTQKPKARFVRFLEKTHHFKPITYGKHSISLFGWFNSEKYFSNHKSKIIDLFSPSEEILTYLKESFPSVVEDNKSVAIHLRTYHKDKVLNSEIQKFHPFVGINYLKKAMKHFGEDYNFYIFSDDITFVKDLIKPLNLPYHIQYIEGNTHYHDFYLMSLCKHNIISNSTFSWWAAYLNKNPKKTVIGPKKWFGESYKHKNTKDVLPDSWIKI